jgi:type I restriction enzyme S subunit
MKRQRAPLSELCRLVKGASPISKTPPGPFPLVTTGEDRKTANSFQFDTEAVCVPLISSTGHGHASLKRIHYQSGKFALANLLAAALVKDDSALSPKFLARYLNFTKDRLIVPLMTGAANMSISIDRLATVPVVFPQLPEQERIVQVLNEADELRSTTRGVGISGGQKQRYRTCVPISLIVPMLLPSTLRLRRLLPVSAVQTFKMGS